MVSRSLKINFSSHSFLILAFISNTPLKIVKNQLLKTIPIWGPQFCISFEMKINSMPKRNKFLSIIHFTTGGDCCKLGYRIPAIWTRANKEKTIHFTASLGNHGNTWVDIDNFIERQWYKVIITYALDDKVLKVESNCRAETGLG